MWKIEIFYPSVTMYEMNIKDVIETIISISIPSLMKAMNWFISDGNYSVNHSYDEQNSWSRICYFWYFMELNQYWKTIWATPKYDYFSQVSRDNESTWFQSQIPQFICVPMSYSQQSFEDVRLNPIMNNTKPSQNLNEYSFIKDVEWDFPQIYIK